MAPVELRLVVDDEREEGGFCYERSVPRVIFFMKILTSHSQEPPESHEPTPVESRRREESH